MNTKYYEDFVEFKRKGMKAKARESVREFIDSFSDEDEKAQWVWNTLPELPFGESHCIRHELFVHLISPVLMAGYERKDIRSILWLGKLIKNVSQIPELHERIGFKSEHELFREAYELDPENREVIELLLDSQVRRFEYCEHEWPDGMLYDGHNWATMDQCRKLRKELALARETDKEAMYSDFLDQFEDKISLYESRLEMRHSVS